MPVTAFIVEAAPDPEKNKEEELKFCLIENTKEGKVRYQNPLKSGFKSDPIHYNTDLFYEWKC